ncbi:MAG TPA: AraC family transcriptional regulator ligand-binding domain-containing protein [Cyclobacteriaceae bacterium]|jgi:AraC-like DNA-binding protein
MNLGRQFTLAMLAYASTRDLDAAVVAKRSGLDLDAIRDNPDASISAAQNESLWRDLVTTSNDPLFGLHLAESMQLAALGVVGQIIQTSRNVQDALTQAGALVPLVSELFRMRTEPIGKKVVIHFSADDAAKSEYPFTYRQMTDYFAVFTIHELDGLLLRKVAPLAAQFPYSLSNKKEYDRLMRCDVRRGKELTITLDSAYLKEPIITANYDLQQHLLGSLNAIGESKKETSKFASRVFNYLLSNAYLFDASLESTAANFNVSARTLQRKLQEENSSFQQIADDVKRHLAVSYLSSGKHQVKDVAYMLGYNEQSALVRAFKRWTGKTPSEFSRQ